MSMRPPAHLIAAASLALFPVLPSCILAIGGGGKDNRARWAWEDEGSSGSTKAAVDAAAPKGDAKPDPAKRELELDKKRRELALAELELAIAQGQAAEQIKTAELEHQKAARALVEAELDLATFLEQVQPQALAKAELEVERQVFRAEQRRQDLQQLVEDYQAHGEEFYAKRTGEIVIWRSERELELAAQALEQQRAALELERDRELPKKQRALEFALEQARAGLAQAVAKRERAQLEAELGRQKAAAKLEDLRRELERLERGDSEDGGSGRTGSLVAEVG